MRLLARVKLCRWFFVADGFLRFGLGDMVAVRLAMHRDLDGLMRPMAMDGDLRLFLFSASVASALAGFSATASSVPGSGGVPTGECGGRACATGP